jgi:hypothetical protein
MPDHHLTSALFVDFHVATGSASIVAPIVIVAIAAVDSVSFTAVRSDAEVQRLGKRDFRFEGDSIAGRCGKSPHCTGDGGDE